MAGGGGCGRRGWQRGPGTTRLATGPRYNVSMCGRVGRLAAGLMSVPSSPWFATRCTESVISVFRLCPFKILIAKRGTGTESGFGVDLVANQVSVRTEKFSVACRECMKTHMIRNRNFRFGTEKWVWRRPCRKSGFGSNRKLFGRMPKVYENIHDSEPKNVRLDRKPVGFVPRVYENTGDEGTQG